MLSPELRSQIRKLWDAFWAGGIANPLTAIEQITYLVFLKRLEDLDNQRAESARKAGRSYQSIFDVEYVLPNGQAYPGAQFRWSNLRRKREDDLDGLLSFMRGPVFNWLKAIEERDDPKADRMRDAVFVIPKASLLNTAMQIIDDLFVPERNQDTLGDIYEMLLSEIVTAGKNGQFRTPRHIIRAMCYLVDPRPGERICDPACGTSGFLINAYQHILANHTSKETLEFNADGSFVHANGGQLGQEDLEELRRGVTRDGQFEHHFFYGFDFDRTMLRLGWMNMIQHGLEHPQVYYADTLGSIFNTRLNPQSGDLYESFDVVLANPPFAGNIDKDNIGETLKPLGTSKTELLFLELILQLLKLGGRAAVIMPEGVLFGSSRAHQAIRRKLVEHNQLTAVISLPGGVFKPYAGVKTSILVFYKGGRTNDVWFYGVEDDGYSLDAKRTEHFEENDLWDLAIQYRLHYPQLFRSSGKITAPAFVRGDWWPEWSTQSDNEVLQNTYFHPRFIIDRRREGDYSVFDQPDELHKTIQQARQQVVTAARAELDTAPTLAEKAALNKLQRRLNALKRQHKNDREQWHAALLEEKESLEQLFHECLVDERDQVRKRFVKVAEEAGIRTSGDELYGLDFLHYALDEALSTFDVEARMAEILPAVQDKLDHYMEAFVAEQDLPALSSPSGKKAKKGSTPAQRVKLVRPFARLDGYERWMLGRISPLTAEVRQNISKLAETSLLPTVQFPKLPKWWSVPNKETAESDYNLTASRYQPFTQEEVEYDRPEKIITDLQDIEVQIQEGLSKLLDLVEGRQ